MSIDELRELCNLTIALTELRQNECKHLYIEYFAPTLLANIIREYRNASEQKIFFEEPKVSFR